MSIIAFENGKKDTYDDIINKFMILQSD